MFPSWKISKKCIELYLWNWLLHSRDRNFEYTPATNVLNLMLLSQLSNEPQNSIKLLQRQDMSSLFKTPKARTEKMRKEFVFRTSRRANKVNHLIDFSSSTGLKKRIIHLLCRFVETKSNEKNNCTRQLACDC